MAAHGSLLRDSTAQHDSSTRTLRGAKCSLCGLERPIGLMVPDGGDACTDLRWYCKDARSCTQRWTSRLQQPVAETAAGGQHEPGPTGSAPANVTAEVAEVAAEQYV
jgi:hypothetical protein